MTNKKKKLLEVYATLEGCFGDLGWWPGDSWFEVVVGAVLTQNTAWANVRKAVEELKERRLLDPGKIGRVDAGRLSRLIRPAGYFRVKARRLKAVSRFLLDECDASLRKLKKKDTGKLREKLLRIKGVGPETADSILVYALEKPVFVVDAYTKRVFSRHGIVRENASYDEVQALVHENFPKDPKALNQFHALLVEVGKRFCKKKKGLCKECPLGGL